MRTTIKVGALALMCLGVSMSASVSAALAQDILPVPEKVELPKSAQAEEKPGKPLPPCLAEIARAQTLEDAALKSSKLRASLLEAQKMGLAAKDDLVDMAQNATPAGRVFSVALLKKLDAPLAAKLTETLKQESGDQSVSYISPTERCHYSVSDILNDMASAHPLIKVLPAPTAK